VTRRNEPIDGCTNNWLPRATSWTLPLFVLTIGTAYGQASPRGDSTRSSLPPLHLESIAFDPERSRLVIFGGSDSLTGTWEWDGTRWERKADSVSSPFPRGGAAMAYDPSRRRIVLFGGQPRRSPNGPRRLCDTWTFDGGQWALDNDAPCVTDRVANSSLAYDGRRRTMLLVDGTMIGRDTVLRPMRIWRWTQAAWQLVDSAGPRRTGFSQVAYDDARGVLVVPVLFGGPDAGVWEWDGSRWRHIPATGPSTRQTYALLYDAKRRRVILMGGQGTTRGPYFADMWAWDGRRWTEIANTNGPAPTGRGGANLVRDARNDRLIYFGGYDEAGPRSELWTLGARGWTLVR
jgi:hypothetical protein